MVEPVKLVLPVMDSDANALLVLLEISVRRLVCTHTNYKNLTHVLFDLDLSLPNSSDFRNTVIKLGKWDGEYYSCCSGLSDKSILPAENNHQVKLRPIYRCGAVDYKENTVWLYLVTKQELMKEFTSFNGTQNCQNILKWLDTHFFESLFSNFTKFHCLLFSKILQPFEAIESWNRKWKLYHRSWWAWSSATI